MVASGINKLFWIWTLSQGFLLFIYPIQGKKKENLLEARVTNIEME